MTRKGKVGVAVAIVVAAIVGASVPLGWDAYTHRPAHISNGYAEPGSSLLTLEFGSCGYDYAVGFTETATEVTVTILTSAHRLDPCDDIGDSITLPLDEPLGDRALVNGPTGERIPVSEPLPD